MSWLFLETCDGSQPATEFITTCLSTWRVLQFTPTCLYGFISHPSPSHSWCFSQAKMKYGLIKGSVCFFFLHVFLLIWGDLDSRQLIFMLDKKPMQGSHHRNPCLSENNWAILIESLSHFYRLSERNILYSELLQDPDLFPKEELFYLEEEIKGNCILFLDSLLPLCLYIVCWVAYAASHSKASSSMAFFTGMLVLKK